MTTSDFSLFLLLVQITCTNYIQFCYYAHNPCSVYLSTAMHQHHFLYYHKQKKNSRCLIKVCQLELPGCFWPLGNIITVKAVNKSRTSSSSSNVNLAICSPREPIKPTSLLQNGYLCLFILKSQGGKKHYINT